jgi:hypothetical protein
MDCRLKKADYKLFRWEETNIIINLEQLAITFLEVFHYGLIKYFTFPRSPS